MISAVRLCVFFLGLSILLPMTQAAYAPLGSPESWEFTAPTPAFSPENGDTLGDFQPGITVKVLEVDMSGGTWLVEYTRYGSPPIRALIAIPDLSKSNPRAFASVREDIDSFPLLKKQLQALNPWEGSLMDLRKRLFSGDAVLLGGTEDAPSKLASSQPMSDGFAWNQMPVEVRLENDPNGTPRLVINYWNKGDRDSTVDPRRGYDALREKLERLEAAFDTGLSSSDRKAGGSGISALSDDTENFFLPNDIQAKLRYRLDEYLILELGSFSSAQGARQKRQQGRERYASQLSSHVKTSGEGERYVSDIPMITQGDKGYCVAATLARVLTYYGYPVDMYAVAELAETDRYGTTMDNVIASIRRVSGTTPFRMKELDRSDPNSIHAVIEQGVPIIWLIPRHCRLIIGIHPDTADIVYSDSWGPEHAYKTMPYEDFVALNEHMYILEPQR